MPAILVSLEIMFNSMIHQMCEVEVNLANKHFETAIKKVLDREMLEEEEGGEDG